MKNVSANRSVKVITKLIHQINCNKMSLCTNMQFRIPAVEKLYGNISMYIDLRFLHRFTISPKVSFKTDTKKNEGFIALPKQGAITQASDSLCQFCGNIYGLGVQHPTPNVQKKR